MSAPLTPWGHHVGRYAAALLQRLEEWGGDAYLGQLRGACRDDRRYWPGQRGGFERTFAVALLEALGRGLLTVEPELDEAGRQTGEAHVRLHRPAAPEAPA